MTVPLKRLFLVDGSGYIFRAYHSLPPMSRRDGTPVNAVFGFTSMLMKLIEDMDADHLAVIFDAGRHSFRNEIYDQYKAQRPDPPEDLIPQFSIIRDAVRAFNVPCIERTGFEADDLIATYARRAREDGAEVTIVSSDKDLMQIVSDGVRMLDPMKNRSIGPDEVMEKFGVGPEQVTQVQALAGDSVDNVPGVPGIGVKTAAQLIGQYGDVETLLASAHEIKQPKRRQNLIEHADMARISLQLVTLKSDVEVTETLDDFSVRPPEPQALAAFLTENGFKSILARLGVDPTPAGSGSGAASPDGQDETAGDNQPIVKDYRCVTSLEDLRHWVTEARSVGTVAVDTETDSLNARSATLVGVSLAVAPGQACYIPFAHRDPAPEGQLDLGDGSSGSETSGDSVSTSPLTNVVDVQCALALLKELLEDPAVLKVGHNFKYDLHVFCSVGIRPTPIDDTMVMSSVLDGAGQGHGMDALAERHLGITPIPFSQVCGTGKAQITFDLVPLDQATAYAAEDADVTLRLHQLFRSRLVEDRRMAVYETLDRPMIQVLTDMEADGIRVDAAALKGLSSEFAKAMGDLEDAILELAGEQFNIASPKQLGEILFDRLGLPGGKKSKKTGAYSTDASVLEELAAQGHDLPIKVLEWRQYAKLKSTYTDALIEDIDPRDQRVHTTYGLTHVATGRLSSNDPNLQNIPIRTDAGRRIREAFVAAPDHLLISADYSQIELRLVAHVAEITALRQAFAEGLDIHAITASKVFGVPVEGMDPMVRRRAKAINFGIIYGISAHGLGRQLGIPRGEAQRFIDAYFEGFPEIKTYMESMKAVAKTHGAVFTPLGRRCPIRGITDKNPNSRGFAERQAINAPIQGGAADIIKRAMAQLPGALSAAGCAGTRMLLQVHDELVFEAPKAEADRALEVVKHTMETAVALTDATGVTTVPLVVDVGMAESWAEAH